MRKQFLFMLTLVLIMASSIAFASQEVIEVRLNDKYIDFTDDEGNRVDPALINSRTMVPMRKIFETFGAEVLWDASTQKVTAKTAEKEITLQIDNAEAQLKDLKTNETKNIKLDASPVILNSRTMVPVRFIAESLEKQVGWDAQNRVVVIIDYDEIIANLQKDCSTYLEMLKEQTVEVKTFDIGTTIKGTLSYKDGESSKNNESLTVTGNISTKKSEDKSQLELNIKFTGKGKLLESIKENGYNHLKMGVITDLTNGDVYSYSSLVNNGKWIKNGDNSAEELYAVLNATNVDFEKMLKVSEDTLTKDSYDSIADVTKTIQTLFGNDRIKVNGKSTKTYTITWGLDEVLSNLNLSSDENVDELLSLGKAAVELSNTYKNGMNTKTKVVIDLSLQMKDTKEQLSGSINTESKLNSYNKNVKITLPKV